MQASKARKGASDDWRRQLKDAVRSVDELVTRGYAAAEEADAWRAVATRYPVCVTPYYLGLIDRADTADPIRRQCLPDPRELDGTCLRDPFDETGSTFVPGLVQRYPDRALVMTTGACAVACRHCTRKNILSSGRHTMGESAWHAVCGALRSRTTVREVILSGGDPLLLATARLGRMLHDLHAITHVRVVRIGTRVPAVLPMRIDDSLADTLAAYRPLWVNTQFNHPAELTSAALAACERLVRRGIPVSNQAVLLRGVNDDVDTLSELCNTLQQNMIRSYYVFQCDRVRGTEHVHTPLRHGIELSRALRARLGGLALPRFVADLPGADGKVPLAELSDGRIG